MAPAKKMIRIPARMLELNIISNILHEFGILGE